MKKFVCTICGYVHEGDTPPEFCPICKAPASKFKEQEGEKVWASEHVVGVAKDVPEEIKAGLRENFHLDDARHNGIARKVSVQKPFVSSHGVGALGAVLSRQLQRIQKKHASPVGQKSHDFITVHWHLTFPGFGLS